jgi:hypothetical protein
MTSEPGLYKPGDTVPQTGIYDVTHDNLDGQEHTPPHPVTALQGKLFPPCRACQEHVRFRLHQAADLIDTHHCFQEPAKGANQ